MFFRRLFVLIFTRETVSELHKGKGLFRFWVQESQNARWSSAFRRWNAA